MIPTVELQCQLPIGDVPPGAVERGGVLSALALAEDEVAVSGTAESGGAGNHVHGIIVVHLSQMMDHIHTFYSCPPLNHILHKAYGLLQEAYLFRQFLYLRHHIQHM